MDLKIVLGQFSCKFKVNISLALNTLFFCLSDDWQSPRPSAQFLLGDMMKFEVSLKRFHHIPLRVTVDRCVATMLPSVDTVPRYYFLGNSGSVYCTGVLFCFFIYFLNAPSLRKTYFKSIFSVSMLHQSSCLPVLCVAFRCLFDSQLTGSSSQFLPRSQDDKLQFEVEAFMFHQEDSGIVSLTHASHNFSRLSSA